MKYQEPNHFSSYKSDNDLIRLRLQALWILNEVRMLSFAKRPLGGLNKITAVTMKIGIQLCTTINFHIHTHQQHMTYQSMRIIRSGK